MNVQQALEILQKTLRSEQPEVDARYLLSFIVQKNFTWIKTWPEHDLTNSQTEQLNDLVKRRNNGEPIAYITGEKDFWSLNLETNNSTLIPRPETELLVEKALDFLAEKQSGHFDVLDLGTGTGAIALAIASERSGDNIIGCDFQLPAVELAIKNGKRNRITNARFVQSDWFAQLPEKNFDLIVSNPPYVEENDTHLQQGDLRFEPKTALISSGDGLDDIRLIVRQAKLSLNQGGGLMIEHGFEQGRAIRELMKEAGYNNIETHCDLTKLERMTSAVYVAQ